MDVFNTTESLFTIDDNANVTFDVMSAFNATSNVTAAVARHNCTGADAESMKTYYKVSWWFAGIVQV
jgi:hypothetical protein